MSRGKISVLKPDDFLAANSVTFEDYQGIAKNFPHVGSFAYWPQGPDGDDNSIGKGTSKKYDVSKLSPFALSKYQDYDLIAPELVVDPDNGEAEFNQRLYGKLHKGVAIIGHNFGVPKNLESALDAGEENESGQGLLKWMTLNYLSNQYGSFYGQRLLNNNITFYKYTDGAYMTDFFKYSLGNNGLVPDGMPSKDSNRLNKGVDKPTRAKNIAHNARGLRKELIETLHAPEDIILVLLGAPLNAEDIKEGIHKELPKATIIQGIAHYGATIGAGESEDNQPRKSNKFDSEFQRQLTLLNVMIEQILVERGLND